MISGNMGILHSLVRWLNLEDRLPAKKVGAISLSKKDVKSELPGLEGAHDSVAVGKQIVALRFPKNSLMVLIRRDKNP